jgi:hypothetical protein
MKIQRRLMAASALCAMTAASLSLNVRAEKYAPVSGSETSFDKYLVIDANANVPAAEFSFAIAPGTPLAASENGMEVLAGPGTPTITNTAVFTPEDDVYSTVQEGDILTLAAGEKYAFSTVAVDFTGVQFDEPGIYRYTVSETALDSAGAFTQDSEPKVLDVYVTDEDGSLVVASYVMHSGTAAPLKNADGGSGDVSTDGTQLADKVTGFINRYTTADLTITKQVAGSQASRDKYFLFTLNISDAGKGTRLIADVTENAESAPLATSATSYSDDDMKTANSVTELVCDDNGHVTQNFYLKHGQSVTIRQLPYGASYTLTEAAEDYVSADLHSVEEETYAAASGTIGMDDLTAGFRNTRDGIIPTGIAMSMLPYAVLIFVGAAGFAMTGTHRLR